MTHVVQQIADAVVATIREAVPELADVYKFGTPPSGRRKFPIATVVPGGVDVETQLSGNRRSGRVQTRVLELGVAITAETSNSTDYASGLTDIAAKVEKALAGWEDLPIEDIRFTADSGVQDEREDGEVAEFAGLGMTFEIRFFTVERDSTAFIEPN